MVRWWCCSSGGCTVPFALFVWALGFYSTISIQKRTQKLCHEWQDLSWNSRDLGDRLARSGEVFFFPKKNATGSPKRCGFPAHGREQRINGCETATVCLNGPLFHVNVQRCKSLPNDLPAHRQSDAAPYASSTGRRNDSAWFLGGPRERLLHVAAKGKTGYKIKDAAGTQIGERAV